MSETDMLSLYTYSLQMLCECISDLHNTKLHLYLTINGSQAPTSVTFNPDIVKNLKPLWYYEKRPCTSTYNTIPNLQTHFYLTCSAKDINPYSLEPSQRVKIAHLITEDIQSFLAPEFKDLPAQEV